MSATFASKRRVIVSRKAAGDAASTDDEMSRIAAWFVVASFAVFALVLVTM